MLASNLRQIDHRESHEAVERPLQEGGGTAYHLAPKGPFMRRPHSYHSGFKAASRRSGVEGTGHSASGLSTILIEGLG